MGQPIKGTRLSHLVCLAVIYLEINVIIDHTSPHIYPPHTTHHPLDIIRLTSLRDGQTALHRAANTGKHEIVSLLLMKDPLCAKIQDKEGNTALDLARHKGHKRTMKILLVRKLEVLASLA